jgi:outer membrane usher protein
MPASPSRAVKGPLAAVAIAAVALVLTSGFGRTPARANETGAAAGSPRQSRALQLEVFVNEASTQMVAAFTQLSDGRLAATRKELTEAGLKPPQPGNDEDLIVLSDLEGLIYHYDEPRQRIDLVVPNELRMPHLIDARAQGPPVDTAQAGYGAVMNYTLYASTVKEVDQSIFAFSGASAQLDGRVFTPLGYLQQTAIIGTTLAEEVDALRLDTTFSYSDTDSAVTYRAGDSITRGPLWARPIRFGGLQMERNFALRPDIITAPLPAVSGSAAVPSTVEVLVDNLRTFSRDVPAGPYRITNLPVLSGGGNARVVLRDASGRSVETDLPFFTSPQLLNKGLVDYSLQAGLPRLGYAVRSNSYATKPMVVASARYGLFDSLTLETHAEGGAGVYNGGAGFVTNAGAIGVFGAAGRASYFNGRSGFQAHATFETRLLGFTLNLSTQRSFGAFEDLASVTARMHADEFTLERFLRETRDPTAIDVVTTGSISRSARPPRAIDRISIGMPLPIPRASLGISLINLERQDDTPSRLLAASYSQMIGKSVSLSVNAFADLMKRKDAGIFVGLSMPLGDTVHASVGGVSNSTGLYATADASKPLGVEPGSYGWRVRNIQGKDSSYRTGAASYRSEYGRAEVAGEQFGRGYRVSGEVEGSVATMGGGVFLANRIDDSFAVVDVGAPGVEVFHENRSVGRTGASGRILVPSLRSHQRNRISVDGSGLPVDAHIAATDEIVVPAQKAGVRLDFGVKTQDNSAVVILHDGHGQPLKPGLRGRIDGAGEAFVVGYDGRTFVRELRSSNTAVVEFAEGECRATFPYAPEPGRQVVIGPVACL